MFAVQLTCKVKAQRQAVEGLSHRLQEGILHDFRGRCTSVDIDGTDATPGRAIEVKLCFMSAPSESYNPGTAAKIAEAMADEARVLGQGRTSSVTVSFFDTHQVNQLDEYVF